jgi:hypothetical protein
VKTISPSSFGVAEGKAIEVANSNYAGNIVSGGEVVAVSNERNQNHEKSERGRRRSVGSSRCPKGIE